MENSERDGNTRPPDLPLEKCVCRSEATVRTLFLLVILKVDFRVERRKMQESGKYSRENINKEGKKD